MTITLATSDSRIETLNQQPGLVVSVTESIRSFLIAASEDPTLSSELRNLACRFSIQSTAPYKLIRGLWLGADSSIRPSLIVLFAGSKFVFTSPKPPEKSEELKARLKKLTELAEQNAYEELVKDITPEKKLNEPFSTYKDQLGFGLHVIVTMFTGYLVGYAAFRALFGSSPVMNATGGILGFICAMLVETLLFIIRTSSQDLRPLPSATKMKKNQ